MVNTGTRIFNIPFRVFLLTMILAAVGLTIVYSSSASYAAIRDRNRIAKMEGKEKLADDHSYHSAYYLARQCFWIALSTILMLALYKVDYRVLKGWSLYVLLFSLFLLLLCFVPGIGVVINGDRRWIGFGGFTFQPSELAKLALIIYMARMLTDHHDKIRTIVHGVLPALGITALFGVAIILEPDIGATLVALTILFFMWFVGGMRVLHLGALVSAGIPPFIFAIFFFRDRLERILAFITLMFSDDPFSEAAMGKGYQLMQSLIAVGSGGIWGVGLGNSMQKYFLTEQFSDFIFAILCEELGLIGGAAVVLLFILLICQGWIIAMRSPDYYATLLASGISLMLTISVALNLMVVTGLAPTKGLALPLLSYGGSSMLVTMAAMGILMNIGKYIEYDREQARAHRRARRMEKGGGARGKRPRQWWRPGSWRIFGPQPQVRPAASIINPRSRGGFF